MRVLFADKARLATISSLNESLSYPASNLKDVFLDRPYLSTTTTDTVTIDLGEDTVLDSLFLAYCNAAIATLAMTNALGAPVLSQRVNVKRPIETVYFTAVTARYITLTVSLADGLAAWVFGYRASLVIAAIVASPDAYITKQMNVSFDDTPAITYPDNGAGTIYLQDAFATVDGWSSALGGTTVSVSGGSLLGTATSGAFGVVRAISMPSGGVVVFRMGLSGGLSNYQFRYRIAGVDTVVPFTPVNAMTTYSFVIPSSVTHIDIRRNSGGAVGNVMTISWVYAGDGTYTWVNVDSSGNGNSVTPHGALERDTSGSGYGLKSDGSTGYMSFLTPSMGTSYALDFTARVVTLPSSAKAVFLIGSGLNIDGVHCYVNAATGAGYLEFMRSGASEVYTLPAGFFETTFKAFRITVNTVTKVVSVFKSGTLVKSATLTNTPVSPLAGTTSTLGGGGSFIVDVAYDQFSIDGTGLTYDGHRITYLGGELAFTNSPVVASNIKIKGVGTGNVDEYKDVAYAMSKSRDTTTTVARSAGGQTMRNVGPVFRGYDLTIPKLSRADFRLLDEKLGALGTGYPTYFDINEDPTDGEDPVYAIVSDNWTPANRNQFQDITIPILEAK